MLVKECIFYLQQSLKKSSLQEYKLESKLILSHVLGVSLSNLILLQNKHLTLLQIFKIKRILKKRKKHIPLHYIFKVKHFWENDFKVNKNVLIPRNESEMIIEYVLKYKKDKAKNYNILDLGTGSGILGLTLLKEYENANALLVDYSQKALKVAKKNAKKLGCNNRASFLHSYLLNNLKSNNKFDIIVANLPYIDIKEQDFMLYETKKYEPKMALYAEDEGLALYKELLPCIKNFLNKNGIFIFEFGFKQAELIEGLCKQEGFNNYYILKDLNNIQRFCLIYF